MAKIDLYKSLLFFVLAGICEIGGGYIIWRAVKENMPLWFGMIGCIVLSLYGVIATLQPAGFGRTYAAYGGVFVIMSLCWGALSEKVKPDVYDITGALMVLAGTAVIFYAPRK